MSKRAKEAADLPVTLSILVNVITGERGKGVSTLCVYKCKEEGGDNNGGETDKWQGEREMLMKMQSVSKGNLGEQEGDGRVVVR